VLSEEAMWNMQDEVGEGADLFPIPARIEREFAEPVRSLCRADVLALGGAEAGDPAGTEIWDSHVQVRVGIRTESGFVDVATDIRLARFIAEVAEVYVHPAPGSRRALVHITWDHHDYVGDELRWIELPSGAPVPTEGCETRSAIIPLRANLTGPAVDEAQYLLADALAAQGELASAPSEDEAAELSVRIEQGLTVARELDTELTPLAADACTGDGGCGRDAGAPGATEPPSASGASCGGTSHTASSLAFAFPALFAGGLGIRAARRRSLASRSRASSEVTRRA
jgi:hypothetical protein